MNILETDRLILCHLSPDDAQFIYELVNDPDWLKYIGDKNVHNLDDARDYILNGPMASYEQHGFGLYLTKLKESGVPIGICGLLKRDTLKDVDVGFAFMPAFRGKGYATEAAAATMKYGKKVLGIKRIVAVTSQDNNASAQVLKKLGLRYDRIVRIFDDDPGSKLFIPV